MINADWKTIERRAKMIQNTTGLPTQGWAKGLRTVNAHQEECLAI
jgi:spermidine synthase